MDRPTDEQTNGRTDGQTNGWTDGRTDLQTNGPTKQGEEWCSTRLKKSFKEGKS